ncbi:MAG: OadG family protein [Treponema sp.]|jgi:oxaloacetate decarboxylase gamma subunit|nr:OadG family protein [Treponema sp.]
MTIPEMLHQSAILTVLGMAVVFVFLWIMIVCVNLVGRLIRSRGWDKDVRPQTPTGAGGARKAGTTPPEVTAAITTAIVEHRKTEAE